ncbi:MAG TPA: anti-sigma factor [Thermomicrobiales bacterium]|nr:anti-sigma factor [Thermomicrobiales bacterium]
MSTETNEFPEDDEIEHDGHPVALLGRYALGALDPDEVELVARHVQSCPACRAELAGYDEIVSLLPYAAPVQQVPLRARAGLLARLDEIGTSNEQQMVVLPAIPREPRHPLAWLRSSASPRRLAFAAVPLIVILAIVGIMADVINDQQRQIATIESEQAAQQEAVARVMLDGSENAEPAEATFISSTTAPEARAKLIVNYETNSALILARNLPLVENGAQYIAWLRLSTPDEYARAGVLTVAEDGRASLSVEPHDAIQNYSEVIVTLEANPESAIPTGPQVMTASVVPAN